MGETIPPESKSQPASDRDEDPHESVTIAPPAPNFDEILGQAGHVTPVPSLSNRSDQHFRSALDAGQHAGFSLAELSKMAAQLSGGVVGAKRANEQLVKELTTLRAMLGSANELNLGLRHRLAQQEEELAAVRAQAEQERQFLTDQHDEFLAALLEEHEEALAHASEGDTRRMGADVSDLAQKLVQSESARQQTELEAKRARDALAKAQTQRDEAQARAQGRERERDELRAEASMLRARLGMLRTASTTPPPPVTGSRPPSFRPAAALTLDKGELDSTLHSRPAPFRPPIPARHTPPPAELERAVYTPRPVSVTPPPSAEPFPRESTRPGVGGPKPSEPAPPPDFGPPPSGWTPPPPPPEATTSPPPDATTSPSPPAKPRTMSAASMPPSQVPKLPLLKQKPDPTSRPLISYSLGKDGVQSETLEGARLSSKPPQK